MTNYKKYLGSTPVTEKIPGRKMIKNNTGGYVFEVSKWTQLERFLILGALDGAYYVDHRKHARQNLDVVIQCIKEDGLRAAKLAYEVSTENRAMRQTHAVTVWALVFNEGDDEAREFIVQNTNKMLRTFTTLAQFLEINKRSGSRFKRLMQTWFDKHTDKLGMQFVKYRNREGWTPRDALRVGHPIPRTNIHNNLFAHLVGKEVKGELPNIVEGFLKAQNATQIETVKLIEEYRLTHEMINNEYLNSVDIWAALYQHMPVGR